MDTRNDQSKGPPRLALGDYKAVRHSLARIVRMRFRQEIDTATYRDMVYGIATMCMYDKLVMDARVESRLDAIEAALHERETAPATEPAKRPAESVPTTDWRKSL